MGKQHKLSRRHFLRLSAASAGSILLAACGGNAGKKLTPRQTPYQASQATLTAASEASLQLTPRGTENAVARNTAVNATQATGGTQPIVSATEPLMSTLPAPKSFNESPALAGMVKAGKLPKLVDRLPKQPMVLKPVERVGDYGGTLHSAVFRNSDLGRMVDWENLVRWKPDTKQFSVDEVIPNIAESFKVAKNGAEYTFKLREGMKWSDGKPFTANDIMFWYEDVLMNEDLTPTFPDWLTAGGKPVKVEKQDAATVAFKFAGPTGLLLQNLATPPCKRPVAYPAHYMKQFHIKYNQDADKQAKQAGLKDWAALFDQKAAYFSFENSEKPVLDGWTFTQTLSESTEQVVAERNPYYWKVDSNGNQLPYIDKVVFSVAQSLDVMTLKALNGELDMIPGEVNVLQNKAVFYKNRKKGNYHFFDMLPAEMNTAMISLNLTHKDAMKRKVFQSKDFRIGLSYAINRQDIIDTVFVSQGESWQGAPRPESKFHNEKLAKQYTEYDVDKANYHLDKVLPKKNAQGIRLWPNGKPIFFQVDVDPSEDPNGPDVLQIVKRYWNEVGVDMRIKTEDRSLFQVRRHGNLADATEWHGDGGLDVLFYPRFYFPYDSGSFWGIAWASWYNFGGLEGKIPKDLDAPIQEPPATAKEQMKLYNQIKATADPGKQTRLMKQILQIAQEEFWAIGISLPTKGYGIAKNNFHNVPTMINAWLYPTPAPSNPSQYFIEGK